jgi:hypothetical protein
MPEADMDGFECPVCHEPVNEDWNACPACGTEFAPPDEGEGLPLSPPAEARVVAAPVEEHDELEALSREIDAAHAEAHAPPRSQASAAQARSPQAPPSAVRPAPPPPRGPPSPPTRPPAAKAARRSSLGLIGILGLVFLLGGIVGAVVALNYDEWIKGLSTNSVGTLQLAATAGALVVAAVGAILLLRGLGKLGGSTKTH